MLGFGGVKWCKKLYPGTVNNLGSCIYDCSSANGLNPLVEKVLSFYCRITLERGTISCWFFVWVMDGLYLLISLFRYNDLCYIQSKHIICV